MNTDDPRHGTYAGYQEHLKHYADPACEPCLRALRAYMRAYRARRKAGRCSTGAVPL